MYDTSAYWQAQLINWGPRVLIAILILIATWLVARAVKWVIQRAIDRIPALKRHGTGNDPREPGSGRRYSRFRIDHHPRRDRRASGAGDQLNLRPRDGHAQPDPGCHSPDHRGGAVARYRLRGSALPQVDHRSGPA